MFSHATLAGGCMWQGREEGPVPEPLWPVSEDLKMQTAVLVPSSQFEARYDEHAPIRTFKIENDQGRVRVVSNFRQGFTGRAAERYPSGETFLGDFRDAKRHGRGQLMTAKADSMLISHFRKGRPVGEGTKLTSQPRSPPTAARTYDGKVGPSIPMSEASRIVANLRMDASTLPSSSGFSAAIKAARATTPPPKPKYRPPTEYVSTLSAAYNKPAPAVAPTRDAFLAKLEAAERSEPQARMSLIPRT